MKSKKNLNFFNVIFIVLAILLVISRFYKTTDFFYFGVDEEYQTLLAWSQIKNFHITWIGVSASNIGYYLGPGLTYLGAILLWLSKGNPISLAYFASFIGIATALSLFFVAFRLYDFKTGLFSLFLYTFSPFAFYFDRRYWPIAIPLIALWLFYSLIKSSKNPRWLFLTAFLIAVSYHIHITLWLFWPFIISTFFILYVKKKINLLFIIYPISIFILVTLPLLVFDFVHNFDNLKLPLRLISTFGQNHSGLQIFERLTNFSLYFSKIFFLSQSPNLFVSALLLISFFIVGILLTINHLTIKPFNYLTINNKLLASVIFLFFLGFIFFPSPMHEYYFVLPLPFIILTTAVILTRLKYLGYFILFTLFLVNIYSFIKQPIYSDYKNKLAIIKRASNYVKKNQFILEIDGEYLYNGGWRYLFQSNGLTPSQSTADQVFGWIYPDEISKSKPKYKIFISKNKNLVLKSLLEEKFISNIYTVYILKN